MNVITRFAPSPTGFLHIGGARTALFNWLYAKNTGGKFLLRVEDTDRKRSTDEAVDAILTGLQWLGLDWDGKVYHQFAQVERHQQVVQKLLDEGHAYYCYCSSEELEEMRETARKESKPFRYNGKWRHKDANDAPKDVKPTVRLKSPQEGVTIIEDKVQGRIEVQNSELDDMILLRSDGTPTYMLSVVVDDHDMGITHIIRGDDHLTNAVRQSVIYRAMGWDIPVFAHVPLIHGGDGAKLSKRHGALGVEAYRDMGYLPEALRNYLLRLGWSHGDEEIITTEQAIEWFNLEAIGKSPARFDFNKLDNLNGHYIRNADNKYLLGRITPFLKKQSEPGMRRIEQSMDSLKERAKTLKELAEMAEFYIERPQFSEKALGILDDFGKTAVADIASLLEAENDWTEDNLHKKVKDFAEKKELGLGKIAQPLRAAITGSNISPGIFEVMNVLGKDETIERLKNIG